MVYCVEYELKDRLKPGCMPVFSFDGLKHYYYAITAHFGQWTTLCGEKYQVGPARIPALRSGRQASAAHALRSKVVNFALLKAAGLSGIINTSFVERVNLTIRHAIC
jgi:hypothetical protein